MIKDFNFKSGDSCLGLFRQAYENRYTWNADFNGYRGKCVLEESSLIYKGDFNIDKEFNVQIENIYNVEKRKLIEHQLREVCIHRIRRSFESSHGSNSFTVGEINNTGLEVIVGGKSQGDSYRIKDNVITMVRRNIHNMLVEIFTKDIIDTGEGYLGKIYTSQYFNPKTSRPLSDINYFLDEFTQVSPDSPWLLSSRSIQSVVPDHKNINKYKFSFFDLSIHT